MLCKNCGNKINENTKFCDKCGQKVIAETESASEKKVGKKSVLTGVVSIVIYILAFGLAFGVVRYLTQETITSFTGSSSSKAELINQVVEQTKTSMKLPNHVDAATTLVDITAEPNAIRYHYVLAGIDTSSLSDSYLKKFLGSSICQNQDTKNSLDQGINMEYSYVVENTTQSYFVSFSEADCLLQ